MNNTRRAAVEQIEQWKRDATLLPIPDQPHWFDVRENELLNGLVKLMADAEARVWEEAAKVVNDESILANDGLVRPSLRYRLLELFEKRAQALCQGGKEPQ